MGNLTSQECGTVGVAEELLRGESVAYSVHLPKDCSSNWADCKVRVILIGVFEFICLGHTYKLFHFVHWFQNCFRFRSRTLRSGGGKFFSTLVDLEGEKREKTHFWVGFKPILKFCFFLPFFPF